MISGCPVCSGWGIPIYIITRYWESVIFYNSIKNNIMFVKIFLIAVFVSMGVISGYARESDHSMKVTNETFLLLKKVSESIGAKGEIILSVTTHQDLGWVDEVEKCIILRDTLWITPYLERLKNDPKFHMDIEQTSIIVEYLNRHPEKKEEIQKGLDNGRILIGATFTQPYEDMYNGESLIRQFYYGKKWLKQNFNGYNSDTYFNADVPGRTLQMPQIMVKSGVNNLLATRHEKGFFNWYSPDNSKVSIYSNGHYKDFYNILKKKNEDAIEEMAKDVLFWCKYYNNQSKMVIIPAHLNYEFIWDQTPISNCDPFINLWNNLKEVENDKGEKFIVKLPHFKYGNLNECMQTMQANASGIEKIEGERPSLWIYIHGPSHQYALKASREADILLPDAEKFSSIDAMLSGNFLHYDKDKFSEAWQAKIYPDHGWGGKGGEITDRLFLTKFIKARNDASNLLDGSLKRIASRINFDRGEVPIVIFNGLNWKRSDPVSFKYLLNKGEALDLKIVDENQKTIDSYMKDCHYNDDGSLQSCTITFIAKDIPSIGYRTFYVQTLNKPKHKDKMTNVLTHENNFYSIRLGNGGIEKLFDRTTGKEIVEASKFKLGEVFTMKSVGFDAGDFTEVKQPTMEEFDKTGLYNTNWKKIADGPVYTAFKYRQPIRYAVVEETIIIYNGIKRIDIEIDIKNWQGVLYREFRVAFPFNMSNSKINYEVPMGVVEIGKDEIKDAGKMYHTDPSTTHPRSLVDWVNVSDNQIGATISSSVIAFDYIDPTDMPSAGTLIQPILFASRKSCNSEGNEYQQYGDHHFSFSLYTQSPGWKNGFKLGKQARNNPYVVIDPGKTKNGLLPESKSFFSTMGDLTVISALKKSESDDSFVLRLYSLDDKVVNDIVLSFYKIAQATETNLIEERLTPLNFTKQQLNVVLNPFSIKTFEFK
jgi:alpha-mannosidase